MTEIANSSRWGGKVPNYRRKSDPQHVPGYSTREVVLKLMKYWKVKDERLEKRLVGQLRRAAVVWDQKKAGRPSGCPSVKAGNRRVFRYKDVFEWATRNGIHLPRYTP